jgi:hypothetical protein
MALSFQFSTRSYLNTGHGLPIPYGFPWERLNIIVKYFADKDATCQERGDALHEANGAISVLNQEDIPLDEIGRDTYYGAA